MDILSGKWWDASWNPLQDTRKGSTGIGYHCTKVSPGCDHCWAEAMNNRFGNREPFDGTPAKYELLPKAIDKVYTKKPTVFSVQDMGDIFHCDVSTSQRIDIYRAMEKNPQHVFVTCTKRSLNARRWIEWASKYSSFQEWPLPNVVSLVSCCTQKELDVKLEDITRTPAASHGISIEPMLGPIYIPDDAFGLDWVICGCESGPGARHMPIEWARQVRDRCHSLGIAFFFQQWKVGTVPIEKMPDLDGNTHYEFPKLLTNHISVIKAVEEMAQSCL